MSAPNQLPNLDKIFREDEPDFVPSGGSNLAAIFGIQSKLADPHSIKQTAPKRNRVVEHIVNYIPEPPSKIEILIAKTVHAFKLQNGQYASVGKLGLRLTNNVTKGACNITLYNTKQECVSTALVGRNFLYTVQANNYASYCDQYYENWSILFENNESYLQFGIEIGLARYNSKFLSVTASAFLEGSENVNYQDLAPASNKDMIAKEGDNICIKYFVGTEIIQPFKTNFVMSQIMTVEISTDDNWERDLLGSGKGLKRIVFLPPSKQISLGPGFPKERDVMLIIEVTDIKTRITNAEIRMGMSKISDNVQKLLDKFHALELQNATTPTNDKATLDASWKMVLALNASHARVRQNELPKSTDKNILDEKICETQSKISILENNLKKSEEEKESLLQINKDMNRMLQELQTKLSNTNDELEKTKEALEVAKNTIEQCKEKNVSLENRLSNREHVFQADSTSFRQKDIKKKNKEIKQIMNKTYHTLSERFADGSCSELSFDYVKSTIASTIKHITLQVLYEDSDEEDVDSKINKNVDSTIKTVRQQQSEEQTERLVLNASSDNDLSIKQTETSRSTMLIATDWLISILIIYIYIYYLYIIKSK